MTKKKAGGGREPSPPKQNPKPHPVAAKMYTDYRMQPFGTADTELAEKLAAVVSGYESDDQSAAAVLLVTGIASIENHEDRQIAASAVIEKVFTRTKAFRSALNAWILEQESREDFSAGA